MSTQAARGQGIETVTVVGASGLIGTKVVAALRARGHRVVAGSRSLGVDAFTGVGLDDAVRQASVVVDVTNPGDDASTEPLTFFTRSTRNVLAAEARFGVRHHVALSIVGADRLADKADRATTGAGYFHAKRVQEDLIRASGIPFTIVRSTQFFEFLPDIAGASTDAGLVRVPAAWLRPVAADEVARAIADAALSLPANATIELAGPTRLTVDEAVGLALGTSNDPRRVMTDPAATYFGVPVEEDTLLPRSSAKLGVVTLQEWVGTTSPTNGDVQQKSGRASARPGGGGHP